MIGFFQKIVNYIIRPTRDTYHPNRLGPKKFQVKSQITPNTINIINRVDQTIQSHIQNQFIHLSYYQNQAANPHYCVIYLHANNGSRVQGLPYIKSLLQSNLNVCLFDFLGSGLSSGQYISLGINQALNLQYIISHLQKTKNIQKYVLWGRSMGAVTALVYTNRFPKRIAGMILDSPFKDLRKLIKQLAADRTGFPKFLFDPVISYLDSDVKLKTGISIEDLKVKLHMLNPGFKDIPGLFLVSKNDKLVKSHHGEKLFNRYLSQDKTLKYIQIQHHQTRQANIIGLCIEFILNSFQKSEILQKKLLFQKQQEDQQIRKTSKTNHQKKHLKNKNKKSKKSQNNNDYSQNINSINSTNNIHNMHHDIHRDNNNLQMKASLKQNLKIISMYGSKQNIKNMSNMLSPQNINHNSNNNMLWSINPYSPASKPYNYQIIHNKNDVNKPSIQTNNNKSNQMNFYHQINNNSNNNNNSDRKQIQNRRLTNYQHNKNQNYYSQHSNINVNTNISHVYQQRNLNNNNLNNFQNNQNAFHQINQNLVNNTVNMNTFPYQRINRQYSHNYQERAKIIKNPIKNKISLTNTHTNNNKIIPHVQEVNNPYKTF